VIENAGIWLDKWTVAEGMETSMTVNVVNTLFLAALLMPQLVESAKKHGIQPRLVFLVSGLGFQAAAKEEMAKGGKTNVFAKLNDQKKQAMDSR
jgi:short-subunit dehydrogenase